MATQLSSEIVALFSDRETVKVLATIDAQGVLHAVVKQSLSLDDQGNIVLLELLESSRTNKNLLHSLWYQRRVCVLLTGRDGLSYEIRGLPIKSIVAGPRFQEAYQRLRERRGDVDLAAVWVIEPEEVTNETFAVRQAEENATHPFFRHLDRLARNPVQ